MLSGADLGFTQPAPREEIYARGLELGLSLCPAEIGPVLRLAFLDPPGLSKMILVAMKPIMQEWHGDGRVVESEYRVFGIGLDYMNSRYLHPISARNALN